MKEVTVSEKKPSTEYSIHPNAIICGVFGAIVAVWIAGQHGSVIGGEAFLAFIILGSVILNRIKKAQRPKY